MAEQHGTALNQAITLLQGGALVGPAGDRLHKTLASSHHEVRSAFYAAFDAVQRAAAESGPPPRVPEPHIPGAPRGGPRGPSDVRSGSPSGLHQLADEISRAARSWRDAAGSLSHILGGLGLSVAPARTISRAADRVAAERPDIERRRDELLEDERRQLVQTATGSAQAALTEKRGLTDVLGRAFGDTWNMYTGRYLAGVWEGSKDIGLTALASNPLTAPFYFGINRKSWMERGPIGQAKSLYYGIRDPGAYAKAAVDWEGWKEDPVRAYGEAVPGIVISVLTGGTGSTAGLATRLGAVHPRRTPPPVRPTNAQSPPKVDTKHSDTAFLKATESAHKADNLGKQSRPTKPSTPTNPTLHAYRSQESPGGKHGPPVSLNTLRYELGRVGMWKPFRQYDIVYLKEIPGEEGIIRYGDSPHNTDGTPKLGPQGKPLIWISEHGLSSLEQAVATLFHESWHQRKLAAERVPGLEEPAEDYGQMMLQRFLQKRRAQGLE
ncbi:hypothetical protein ACFHW2_32210 [Actinomadura sp. LOL_016]|uniref:hypothetical protein n=1 Tax=unclassified Actinomadura TaxID=2626254 RepID=UPI003A8024FB